MGSSADRKKVGDAIQARRAPKRPITSTVGTGEAGSGSVGGGGEERHSELVVPLVRIDREVLTRSTVGESVRLHQRGEIIAVISGSGQIGEIPPGYLQKVRTGGYSGGVITDLKSEPTVVKVTLF